MKKKRDLTAAQFHARAVKLGFRPTGVFGYCNITETVSVSVWNAGERRRDQLAYLIREHKKHAQRAAR